MGTPKMKFITHIPLWGMKTKIRILKPTTEQVSSLSTFQFKWDQNPKSCGQKWKSEKECVGSRDPFYEKQ